MRLLTNNPIISLSSILADNSLLRHTPDGNFKYKNLIKNLK